MFHDHLLDKSMLAVVVVVVVSMVYHFDHHQHNRLSHFHKQIFLLDIVQYSLDYNHPMYKPNKRKKNER
jgi:hypothetical protein